MLFVDRWTRTIDDKHRIQIPAPYRNAMDPERDGAGFYVGPGERETPKYLALYPEKYFESRIRRLRTEDVAGDDPLTFEQSFFSQVSRVEPDKQGRILLPERLLADAELGTEVTLIGAKTRLEIWRTADYEEFLAGARTRWAALQRFLRSPSPETE